MSFASDLFSGLAGFRDHLAEIASPLVGVVEADMAKLSTLLVQDVHQAEQVAKDILHGLYSKAVEPEQPAEPAAPAPVAAPVAEAPAPAPAEPVHAEAAPVAAPGAEPVAEAAPVVAEPEPPTTATA